MKCQYCNRTIPDESVFCMICGERVARKKREKKKEIKVPAPRQLKSGAWNIELRKEGQSITEPTKEECIARAQAIRAGFLKAEKAPQKQTLRSVVESYINDNAGTLSPSTIRGYDSMLRSRFQDVIDDDVNDINWQAAISAEAQQVSPKTVVNGWRLVSGALRHAGLPVPTVNLPQVPHPDRDWLDYSQIQAFLQAVRGKRCELACLLALHSLRESEIRALTKESLQDGVIHIRGAVVPDRNQKLVYKAQNKSRASRRDIPVMIPRVEELWPGEDEELHFQSSAPLRRMIESVCEKNNLPVISIHELRHSFASLAWHLKWDLMTTCAVGGWSTPDTVQKIYTHLAQRDKNRNISKMKAFYKRNSTNDFTNGIKEGQ